MCFLGLGYSTSAGSSLAGPDAAVSSGRVVLPGVPRDTAEPGPPPEVILTAEAEPATIEWNRLYWAAKAEPRKMVKMPTGRHIPAWRFVQLVAELGLAPIDAEGDHHRRKTSSGAS